MRKTRRKSRNPRSPKPLPQAPMGSLSRHRCQFLARRTLDGNGRRILATLAAGVGSPPIGKVQEARRQVVGTLENKASPGTGTSTAEKENDSDMTNLANRLRPARHTQALQSPLELATLSMHILWQRVSRSVL